MERYEYLAHHGIKGMKWGVRQYQNEDGSLTPAGEKRYAKKANKLERKAKIQEGKAASYEDAGRILKYIGGASLGTVVGMSIAVASAPAGAIGAGTAVAYLGGKAITKAMYDHAASHAKKMADKKYSEALEYRKRIEGDSNAA